MDINKVNELRKRIIAAISECKQALEVSEWDVEKAFIYLKRLKISEIIKATEIDDAIAFENYQKFNGDINRAIENIKYHKDSKEWELVNAPKIEDFIEKINKTTSVYDLFKFCPMENNTDISKLFDMLYNFYSACAPGELDNIIGVFDEEIRNSLIEINCIVVLDIFDDYIEAYQDEDSEKINKLDKRFWNNDAEFYNKLKNYMLNNIDIIFHEKMGM